jgi:Bacterial Ig-like domain (group 3)/Bacterial Ig-like domain (group 2)/Dockerin type I domain
MTTRHRPSSIGTLSALVLLFVCASFADAQQVAITSPANGSVYAPGATINVTATATGPILGVKVGAQEMGTSAYQVQSPYLLTLRVPSDVVGPRNLFAVGLIADNTAVFSPLITVDIEPSTPPAAINFQQALVAFGYVGQQQKVGVTATFADGSTLDVSKSTRLAFTSGNATLVSVDSTGLMTSLAPGDTTITATFGSLTATLQTVGPTSVTGDLNGDGLVTLDDLLLLETIVGSTPTGPNDARDINGDGKIDNLDVQALLTLCGGNCPSLASTTTGLASSASQLPYAQPVTFTATVAGTGSHPPTGSVSFLFDGQLNDIGILQNTNQTTNQTTIVSTSLSNGDHTIRALYGGDQNNAPSSSQSVTVTIVPVPPTPILAVSRLTHGSAGTFDVNLPLTGTRGVECRSGGSSGNYSVVFTFVNDVTNCGSAGTIGGSIVSGPNTNQCTENLTGVPNAQYTTVALNNVVDSENNTGNVSVPMGVLIGDTTANGAVNSSDIAQTQSQSGQPVTMDNFREDVTVNGSINSSDISLVQSQSGMALPPPPPPSAPAASPTNLAPTDTQTSPAKSKPHKNPSSSGQGR